ncbi:MAG: glycoside hydrolase family 38 C-terminal domain-containing protein, partial [Bacteroidota bacterium]
DLTEVISRQFKDGEPALFNDLSWDRTEVICLPEPIGGVQGQDIEGGTLYKCKVPSLGHAQIGALEIIEEKGNELKAEPLRLENDLLKITWNEQGLIDGIYDKEADREAIVHGEVANHFKLYEDIPNLWDAWDIDIYYDEITPTTPRLVKSEVIEEGPLRATISFHFEDEHYKIEQHVSLCTGSSRIDFKTKVDWRESEKMLRVDFPVNVYSDKATFEIQYGNLQRPTHYNTSWDMAQFEVVAHKWCDLSQTNYGVALLNDCKYGHKIKGNTISLNLLRSPKVPDPDADMHVHEFTYSLIPHAGDYIAGNVVKEAYQLNNPITIHQSDQQYYSLLQIDSNNVIVENVKRAEDGKGLIVRLYECHGADVTASIDIDPKWKICQLVNLLERSIRPVNLEEGRLSLDFGPFEIHTLKFTEQ